MEHVLERKQKQPCHDHGTPTAWQCALVLREKADQRENRDEVVDACLMEFEQMYYAESLLEEGRKTGMEEGVKQLVAQMLADGKSPNEIHDFCNISMELIESVQEEHQRA